MITSNNNVLSVSVLDNMGVFILLCCMLSFRDELIVICVRWDRTPID